jgi:hypothetical protein
MVMDSTGRMNKTNGGYIWDGIAAQILDSVSGMLA